MNNADSFARQRISALKNSALFLPEQRPDRGRGTISVMEAQTGATN
jgi:hypothetical protein